MQILNYGDEVVIANYATGFVQGNAEKAGYVKVVIHGQGIHEVPAAWVSLKNPDASIWCEQCELKVDSVDGEGLCPSCVETDAVTALEGVN